MELGEKYLVLQVGDVKIPFFPTEVGDEKRKCYKTTLTIWVNEKKAPVEKANSSSKGEI